MTRHNIPLGKILGIPIGLDYSWFLIFVLLTWSLATGYYPVEFKYWSPPLYWFTLHRIKEVPRYEWVTTSVAEVMVPLEQLKRTDPDTELWTALQQMDRDGVNQLPVMQHSQVIGMLSREDVITFLRTLQELGM